MYALKNNECFMCTKDINCFSVTDNIINQVEYLMPEITVIKLGIPLQICLFCYEKLHLFNEFKQVCVQNNLRLETSIKTQSCISTNPEQQTTNNNNRDMMDIVIKKERIETTDDDNELNYNSDIQNIQEEEIVCKKEPQRKQFEEVYIRENIKLEMIDEGDKNLTSNQNECYICKKVFKEKRYLNSHMVVHCSTKNFQCAICNKPFARNPDLTVHMKNVHNGVKNYSCTLCNKTFNKKYQLTIHTKVHNGIKDIKCEICDRLFTTAANLQSHLKSHTVEKDLSCPLCEAKFKYSSSLRNHLKFIHNTKKSELNSQPLNII